MLRSKGQPIDWDEIERDYDHIKSAYIPYRVMSEEDFERCKLSDSTYGMIDDSHVQKFKNWDCVYVVDFEKRQRLIEVAATLELPDERPAGRPEDGRLQTLWEIVDSGINARQITFQFFCAWTDLNFNFGAYLELYVGCRDEYMRQFHQKMMANADSTIIQRHWYAHWITNAEQARGINREIADRELIKLLEEIARSKRAPWGPYPIEWFTSILQTDSKKKKMPGKRAGVLNDSYTKLTNRALKRMIEHPHITLRVLPPLAVDKFRPL